MVYDINTNLIETINFLRQRLEYLLEKDNGEITQETIKSSQKSDELLVLYYRQIYA